ncbi:MAG: hypothetical protein LBI87_10675 [Candidatus Accumulibacter sp.]|jgi:hypothetical protein|nr:hypothetical protein [Accumulibacter sp.]
MKKAFLLVLVLLAFGPTANLNAQSQGRSWPDNEFTKLIPKPDWDSFEKAATMPNIIFSANYKAVNITQAKAYVEKLKQAGFNVDVNEPEVKDRDNNVLYKFGGSNEAGYRAAITIGVKANQTTAALLLTVSKNTKK